MSRPLTVWDLVPIFSWLALRGRCRGCKEGIALRYPLVEAITALGFVLIALRFPVEQYGPTAFVLAAIYAMLVMMSAIDIDEYILPDSLTLPAVAVGLLGSFFYATPGGLPSLQAALFGGALGAGIIVLINRLGALVLRRFADTKERLFPIGLDQVNVAFVGGALGGWDRRFSACGCVRHRQLSHAPHAEAFRTSSLRALGSRARRRQRLPQHQFA